eukprot:Skav234117  [mRNA]  locus=scaffold4383:8678:8989:- [translate_table: standard]
MTWCILVSGLIVFLPSVAGEAALWRTELREKGFAFPLGRLDAYLTAELLDQVKTWEVEGVLLEQQNNTWNSHLWSDAVMKAATDPQILDAVQNVVGEDVVLLQ